jgi:sulfite oxidase
MLGDTRAAARCRRGYRPTAMAPDKRPDLVVHDHEPFNAEPPAAALAASAITPADAFYVRSHGPVPPAGPGEWRLRVGGLVGRELELTPGDLSDGRFEERELVATLVCAGNRRAGLAAVRPIPGELVWGPGAVSTARWHGVALADVLAAAGLGDGAAHVGLAGADESAEAEPPQCFGGSIPLAKALAPEVLLAWGMNGEPLLPAHGAPLRALVPGYVGARSVKWLRRVEVRAEPWDGFFQRTAYRLLRPGDAPGPGVGVALGELSVSADIFVPADGARVAAGAVELRGYALAGSGRHVARVDVSVDGGRTWLAAELLDDLGRWAWRPWRCRLVLAAGDHEVVARAWDSAAATQPERAAALWNPKGYVNTAWGRVRLHAR